MEFADIGIWLAFLAGLASFLSPCVFALVPAYIGYLGGRSITSGQRNNTWTAFSHGLAFVAGFSVIFILLGIAASALGGILYDLRYWLAKIGGIVVIIFGIHLTGLYRIKFLEYDLRPQSTPDRNRGYVASFLMGIFFSAGWSPCVGPILGTILTISLSGGSISQGGLLLTAYSAGLAIPFLIASVQIDLISNGIRRFGKVAHYIEKATGILLIIVGILLFTGKFERLASFGNFFGTFDELEMGRMLLILFIALIILGLVPAVIASRKGRKFIDWWFFGTGLFPIALPMALLIKEDPVESDSVS
ncbi:MAG: cytochrome c biogenesis CcdA family protein [Anaerolineales bacterium]|jgi:cytochrome c-type biogenesis protein